MSRRAFATLANRQWTPGAVAWAGGIFIAAILAMSAYDIVRGYQDAVRNTQRELNSHARVISEQTARTVQAVDVVLRHLTKRFDEGALSGLSAEDLRVLLKEQAVGLVQIDGLLLIGADGTVRASSYLSPGQDGTLNITGGAAFETMRSTRIPHLYIDRVQVSVADGQRMFPMTRRLETSSGLFAGSVGARGRIAYFQEFYRNVRLDEGTTVALTYEDGTLMARHPPAEAALGKPLRLSETTTAALKAKQPLMTRATSPLDGSDRFVVLQPVQGYPLAVFVTREADVALAAWRSHAVGTATRTLALAALATLLIAIVMRQLARVDAARASLEKSQERFAVAVAGSDDGIWDWDYSTGRAFGSQRAREILGLPPGYDMQSIDEWFEGIARQLHPEDAPRRLEAIRAHLAGETPTYEGEYRVRNRDGSYRWVRIRGLCVRRGSEKPHRMAGSVADIDAGKRAAEELRRSEERFALAVAGSGDGIWDFDFTTQVVFASARAREILGMPPGPESQPAEQWFGTVKLHPEDAPKRTAAMEAHIAGKAPAYDGEFRVLHPDGSYRWFRVHGLCVLDASGKPHRMAGSITDIDARKRAEQALRESEERFAIAVAGSDDGIWDFDFVHKRAFNSARGRTLIGMPPYPENEPLEEWLAKLPTYLHPDDVERRREALEAHLEGRAPTYECEVRHRQPDGSYRWLRVRGICVRDADGKPLRMAGSASDIDARKRAEEALRESEERFALAVAGSNDGIVDWDIANDRMYMSPRALEICGIASDVSVRPRLEWRDLLKYHPEDAPRVRDEVIAFLAGNAETREAEYRVHLPNGEYRWIRHRNKVIRNARGEPIRLSGSVSDIDARKKAEAALRESEARYQLAVDGANQGLWDWDMRTDAVYLSPRAQDFLGLKPADRPRSREEWLAQSAIHPDDKELARAALSDHLHGKTPFLSIELRVRHSSGEWHWYRQRGVVSCDAKGRPYRMAGSVEDITAFKQAEAHRAQLEGQLLQAKKLEAIGTLAGGIAHDFNNILAAILGYGEMAQKNASTGTALRRHVDAVVSAGMRAKSLVERILAFSRSGVGERVPVHVQSVVNEALDLVAASLPQHVRLERRLDAANAAVVGDPTQIHQVVMNLCANAAQAMKSTGTLTVSLDVVEKSGSMAATSALATGRYVRVSVRDTGMGIAANVLERIFDPFFTTKEVGVGTGLGLSLVHGIVTDLGGGIDVDSRPGEGATFTVYLPWSNAAAAPAAVEESVAGGSGETILLVDDEEVLVHLGEEMIAMLGYEPVGFTSSSAALAAFRAAPERFNAVLSDESMPEMTGSELARAIRAIRADLPIVLMSGVVSPALSARAKDIGVIDVIAKPLVSRDIARTLAAALRPEAN